MNSKTYSIVVVLFLLLWSGSGSAAVPQRVVSLVPSITENIYALGAQDQLIGVTSWCTYPPEAQEKTIVGDAFHLNLEVLLSLDPDLVIGDRNLVARHLQSLEELGLPVFTVAPNTYDEVAESLISLGQVLGKEEAGLQAAAQMRMRRDHLLESVTEDKKLDIFIETWNEPLSTAGPGSFLHELVEMTGSHNIASDMEEAWGQFSEELVIDRDPDIILLTNYNYDQVMARPGWQGLKAVQNGRVYEVDPDIFSRTSPRLADALTVLMELAIE